MTSTGSLGFSTKIPGTTNWSDQFFKVSQVAKDHGFPFLIYAPVRAHVEATQNWTCTTYPQQWQDLYVEKNYLPRNPVRHHALKSRFPFLWSELEKTLSASDQELFHDCRATGMRDAIVFPIHGPNGQAITVGFACETNDAINPEVVPSLHWLAFRLYHAQDCADTTQEVRLTPRENEMVRLLVLGRDNLQIADEMRITENSVEWHLKNIFRKLDVRNRTSAAIKAFKLGLVHD